MFDQNVTERIAIELTKVHLAAYDKLLLFQVLIFHAILSLGV